jgi:predicted transcriptional regulator
MKGKSIRIEVKDERASARDFIEAWHQAETGAAGAGPVDRLYFGDLESLLRFLTPRRLDALKALHAKGHLSIRALAAKLGRDYRNVHSDVRELERAGLIARDAKGFLVVPWARITAELALAA